jgi:tetratricopeptide (TPR) repeat protein
MNIERILIIVGSIGSVIGGIWAVDEWLLPKIKPGISLFIGNYPWIGWTALVVLIASIAFWIGCRIERKRKPKSNAIQPPPVTPSIPKGASRIETIVDYPRQGATRTTVTIDYLDGLPNTPDIKRRNLFQKADSLYINQRYEDAIRLFRELLAGPYYPDEEIALLILIGNCFIGLGQLKEAKTNYENALSQAREYADKTGEAAALTNIGVFYNIRGILDKALQYHEQALQIYRILDDQEGEANALCNIGIVYETKDELVKALHHLQRALKIHRDTGRREGEAGDLCNIGLVYKKIGELDKALEYFQLALNIHRGIDYRQGEANDLGNIGIVYETRGEIDTALEKYEQALKIFKDIGAKLEIENLKNRINTLRH